MSVSELPNPIDLAAESDFRLGNLQVSPSTREVVGEREREILEPRVMQVLVTLARRRGQVISRDHLIKECWGGRVVGEDAINRCIAKVRRLSEVHSGFAIETITRVGYRVTEGAAPASDSNSTSTPVPQSPPSPVESKATAANDDSATPPNEITHQKLRFPKWGYIAATAALVALIIGLGLWTRDVLVVKRDPSVAVLPFVNLSSDPEQEFFSDGLSEELLNQLAQIKDLRVAGRTSSFSFKGKNDDLRVIGQKLGVDNLLEGSVRRDGDQLRSTAQLIDSRDGSQRWSKTYARETNDMFAVQEEIAREVAHVLSVKLDVGELSRAKGGTTDLAAWEKYQRGRQLLLEDQFAKAEPMLREAVAIDPGFALAWTGLWETLRNRTSGVPKGEMVALRSDMDEAARQTAKLAPESWGAQWIRAMQLREQLRWSEAEAAVAQLLKKPLTAENVEKAWGAVFFYSGVGRHEDSIVLMRRMQQIEPLSLGIAGDITLGYLADRKYDELADAEYQRSKSLEGNHGTANTMAMYRALGDEQADPVAVRAQLRVTWGNDESRWTPLLRELYAKVHDRHAAREFWRQEWAKRADPSRGLARFFVQIADALGDRELALDILTSDALKGDAQIVWWLSRSGLRSDPRFKSKLRDLGLESYFRASGNWGDFCRPAGENDFECR